MTPMPMMNTVTTSTGSPSFVSRYMGNANSAAAMHPAMYTGRLPIRSVRLPARNVTAIAVMLAAVIAPSATGRSSGSRSEM